MSLQDGNGMSLPDRYNIDLNSDVAVQSGVAASERTASHGLNQAVVRRSSAGSRRNQGSEMPMPHFVDEELWRQGADR